LDLKQPGEIITYVARGMEPYRGFPQFMEALAEVQKRRPNATAVIVGADRVAYGKKLGKGDSHKKQALEAYDLDLSRIHFTGVLPRHQYRAVLQVSSVHVYLTVPFVLSWSMMEAMSAGCLLVASDTEPVREVIQDGDNGLLCDFFGKQEIVDKICQCLESPQKFKEIRSRARQTIISRYSHKLLYPEKKTLLEQICSGSLTRSF